MNVVSRSLDPEAFSAAVTWAAICRAAVVATISAVIFMFVTCRFDLKPKHRIWLAFILAAMIVGGFFGFAMYFGSKPKLPRAGFGPGFE